MSTVDELRRQLTSRQALREANSLEATTKVREDISQGRVKLKSDIKKSSAFVKKLKTLAEHNADAVRRDAKELNLTRYISECVSAISDAPLKLADLSSAVLVISELHQRYSEFTSALATSLVNSFDQAETAGSGDDGGSKNRIVRRRVVLRLVSELYLNGVFSDVKIVTKLLQKALKKDGYKSKSKSSSSSSSSSSQVEVPLLVSFAKSVGVEFMRVVPRKYKQLDLPEDEQKTLDDLLSQFQTFVSDQVQDECREMLHEAFDAICKYFLAQHKSLVKTESRNEREEANKGEVSEAHLKELEQAKFVFEKLQTSLQSLADALDKDVPPLPESKDDEDNAGGGISVWEGGAGDGTDLVADSPFDDEDTRSFYEDLPDLLELVPAVVLGYSEAEVAELKSKKEETKEEEEDALESEEALEKEIEEAVVEDKEEEKEEKEENAVSSTAQHDAYFSSLEEIVNRDRCDKAAVDFCYRNSKANRTRLVRTLYQVPRTQLELLAYYSRLVASLQSVLKEDIAGDLVQMLVKEFTFLVAKRNQFRLEAKIKNARFLGELTKFRLCPPDTVFRCLKKCFADFSGHNIVLATTLLESCGRYLYCSRHSRKRTENFLNVMMRLKQAKHLDSNSEVLVDNAYYMCKPPERRERQVKQRDPVYTFTLRKLEQLETDANVVKSLRQLQWDDEKTIHIVVKSILKVCKAKATQAKAIGDVVRALGRYQDALPVYLVDELLERLTRGLDVNDYRDHQTLLSYVRLLGALYTRGVVNQALIFDILYSFVQRSHDLLSLPAYNVPAMDETQFVEMKRRFVLVPEMRFDPRVPADNDSPDDTFRLRLACLLLESCLSLGRGEKSLSKPRLKRFIAYLQRYYYSKVDVSLEAEFVYSDAMDLVKKVALRERMPRATDWEEAQEEVHQVQLSQLAEAEKRVAKGQTINELELLPSEDAMDEDDGSEYDASESEESEEGESDEEVVVKDRVVEEEDELFEKEFKAMMQATGGETRKRVNVDKMALPANVKSAPTTSASNSMHQGVQFRMLKRGNKGKVEARELIVPEETALAQQSQLQRDEGKKEMNEVKRLVLQNVERDEMMAAKEMEGIRMGAASYASRNDEETAGFGGGSEWNNAEFGLRRGRSFRGK